MDTTRWTVVALVFAASLTSVAAQKKPLQADSPQVQDSVPTDEPPTRPCDGPDSRRPVSLTISGGVSLGSYESGVNWALLHLMRLAEEGGYGRDLREAGSPKPDGLDCYELIAATGASAGNINALLSALDWTRMHERPDGLTPEQSALWDVWTSIGLGELLPEILNESGEANARNAVLSRDEFTAIRDRLLGTLEAEGETLDPRADIAVGISMTRINPRTSSVNREAQEEGLRVASQRAATVYRTSLVPDVVGTDTTHRFVVGHHDITRRHVVSDPPPRRNSYGLRLLEEEQRSGERSKPRCMSPRELGQLVLPAYHESSPDGPLTEHDRKVNFDQAYQLSLASSAFPLAFEPVPIRYATRRGSDGGLLDHGHDERFIDGGVFDNNPLSLAFSLYDFASSEHEDCFPDGLPSGGRDQSLFARVKWTDPLFIYIDPDDRREGAVVDRGTVESAPPGLATLQRFAEGVVPATRQHELEMLSRSLTDQQAQVLTTSNRYSAVTGVHLGAFGAFIDRSFREYDFYVGVYDGYHLMARLACGEARGTQRRTGPSPERRAGPESTSGCTRAKLDELRAWSGLSTLSSVANTVFSLVYEDEFGLPARWQLPISHRNRTQEERRRIEDRTRVLAALAGIQDELRRDGRETDFLRLVRALKQDTTVQSVYERWMDDGSRQAESYMKKLFKGPEQWLFQLTETVLDRMKRVEDQGGQGYERMVEAAHVVVATEVDRRTGARLVLAESSVPRRERKGFGWGAWHTLVPRELVGSPGGFFRATWTPAFRLGKGYAHAITFPISLFRYQRPVHRDPLAFDRVTRAWSPSVGVGYRYRVNPFVTAGARLNYSRAEVPESLAPDADEDGAWATGVGVEAGATLLGDKLYLGLELPTVIHDDGWELWEKPRFRLNFGLHDVQGLTYWFLRFLS